MIGTTGIAGQDAGELDRDLIERLALYRLEPGGTGRGEHRLQGLSDGRSVGKGAVRRLARLDQRVKRIDFLAACGARWCAIPRRDVRSANAARPHQPAHCAAAISSASAIARALTSPLLPAGQVGRQSRTSIPCARRPR